MKIDWKRKLSSRKFWTLLIGVVTAILISFNVSENNVAQISAIISAFGLMAVYILTEGAIDKESVKQDDEK